MASPALTQGKDDAENVAGERAGRACENELISSESTWKRLSMFLLGVLFVTGLLLLGIMLFFVLRQPLTSSNTMMPLAIPAPRNTTAKERSKLESLVFSEPKNCTTPENPQPKQAVQEENRVIVNSCGGIVDIPRNSKAYIVNDNRENTRCAWIIKSDMKRVKVRYANESLGFRSGTIIGEIDAGDEGLSCSKLERAFNSSRIVKTPFVLYFTKVDFKDMKFVIKLTPVDDSGSHASQPVTSFVHRSKNGALPLSRVPFRTESSLGLIAVFQSQYPNGFGRNFMCFPTEPDRCCDYVAAYAIDEFESGGSCNKISKLNSGDGEASSNGTMVALYRPQLVRNTFECQMTWSENNNLIMHVEESPPAYLG